MRRATFGILMVAVFLVGTAPIALHAAGIPVFPGGLLSSQVGTQQGAAREVASETSVAGRTLRITSVLADPEQTVVAYQVVGRPDDGGYVMPVPRPRLVLDDGTILQAQFVQRSSQPDGTGTVIFPPLPRGAHVLTLEFDGFQFKRTVSQAEPSVVNARFASWLSVDNRDAYDRSVRAVVSATGGTGKGRLTVSEVSRTPSLIVVRGTLDGLTAEEIQRLGRPTVALTTANGQRVESESGRIGFGPDYRSFEFRFPAQASGTVHLEVRGISPDSNEDAVIALAVP
jgi:ADP-ribose pyrophosphatase YjhB (NUDIX family)